MRTPGRAAAHLTYCTNIHPGESWAEVRANLENHLVAIRNRVAPDRRFGVGLRLSARAAGELSKPAALEELRDFLERHALYVFTLNGFPYGAFHATRVKEAVYRPDWTEDDRLGYSDVLSELLAALLPDGEADLYGSVSTVPIADRLRTPDAASRAPAVERLLRHAAGLVRLYERSGKLIVLALEPEPGCALETSTEAAAFFTNELLAPEARARLAALIGVNDAAAEHALRRHVGVCLDACHCAVEHETPAHAVSAVQSAGIRIAKVQVSAGLRVAPVDDAALARLQAFAEDVYLHQVVARHGDALVRYRDLPEALAQAGAGSAAASEWRIHFHVPLFVEHAGALATTQPFVHDLLALQQQHPFTGHLEVETYTWDVLPAGVRGADVVEDVARELAWVLDRLSS